jgi:hypothetical protein
MSDEEKAQAAEWAKKHPFLDWLINAVLTFIFLPLK